jgi:hypothetical protein
LKNGPAFPAFPRGRCIVINRYHANILTSNFFGPIACLAGREATCPAAAVAHGLLAAKPSNLLEVAPGKIKASVTVQETKMSLCVNIPKKVWTR